MATVKVAMIGTGAISSIYLDNISQVFREIEILGVTDLDRSRAEQAQQKYGIPKLYNSFEDAISDQEVDIVLNLTRPSEHYTVIKAALEAGKHVYTEKPLGVTFDEGQELVALAAQRQLLLGGAPDTFLGAGIQTCRRLIDDGYIGQPVGAAAFMICRGHESWHPAPDFYYQKGGGPMMDMGPYYITALVNLLGGVNKVTSAAKASFSQRTITSEPKKGQVIDVEVPTYTTGILHFESGAIGTLFATFDVYYKQQARFEVYGSEGTLIVPDPNTFGGPVYLLRPEDGDFREMPLLYDYRENSRGLGLADMAKAMSSQRDCRAHSTQLLHVLEVMTSLEKSAVLDASIPITTRYSRTKPMQQSNVHGILD